MRWLAVIFFVTTPVFAEASDLRTPLETLRKVGPDGQHSREAARAWREVARADVADLATLLGGMDGASPLARNWIRSALEPVLARAARAKKPLPTADLEAFLR